MNKCDYTINFIKKLSMVDSIEEKNRLIKELNQGRQVTGNELEDCGGVGTMPRDPTEAFLIMNEWPPIEIADDFFRDKEKYPEGVLLVAMWWRGELHAASFDRRGSFISAKPYDALLEEQLHSNCDIFLKIESANHFASSKFGKELLSPSDKISKRYAVLEDSLFKFLSNIDIEVLDLFICNIPNSLATFCPLK